MWYYEGLQKLENLLMMFISCSYVVTGSKRTTDDIAQFCEMCYKSFFYIDGLLIEEHFQKFSFSDAARSLVSKVKCLKMCE